MRNARQATVTVGEKMNYEVLVPSVIVTCLILPAAVIVIRVGRISDQPLANENQM